jgi:precorrin-6Y C5,15-methyltransferase (decarboxylating)
MGIGQKPLDDRCRKILHDADSILAPGRLMEVFEGYPEFALVKGKIAVTGRMEETIVFIRKNLGKQVMVLLASGDPMFYGIGRLMISACGAEHVEIIPDLSSIQAAFSRIKECWDDAFLMSLHGVVEANMEDNLPHRFEQIPALLGKHRKVAILTDKKSNPAELAKGLMASPFAASVTVHVCEKLGYRGRERITSGTPAEIATQSFADLNVVILVRHDEERQSSLPCFGIKEDEFDHSRGLITKNEIRASLIHALRLPGQGVLWDVGAGCGSVSIEAGRLFPGLTVYAVEKEKAQASHITANMIRFGAANIFVVKGRAPEALTTLPSPDRVFIGGGGNEIGNIIDMVGQRMAKGIIVINAVTLETLNDAIGSLEGAGFTVEVSQISVSRSKPLAGRKQLVALTQVFVIKGARI